MADPFDESGVRLLALHARVRDGDRAALEPLAVELLRPLCRRLRRQCPRAEPDVVAETVHDAILAYAAHPRRFDPARGVSLAAFVNGIAARMLRDRLRAEERRCVREGHAWYVLHWHRRQADDRALSCATVQEIRSMLPPPLQSDRARGDAGVARRPRYRRHGRRSRPRPSQAGGPVPRAQRAPGPGRQAPAASSSQRGGARPISLARSKKSEWLRLGIGVRRQRHQ